MDITRRRGDTYPDSFTLTLRETGDYANLTGCSFLLTLDTLKNPVGVLTNVYQIVGNVPNPANGVVQFSPTLSQADRVGYYYYDVQMTDQSGKVRTLTPFGAQYVYIEDITK